MASETYKVAGPIRISDAFLGESYSVDFAPGTHDPKNDIELHALEHAVSIGLAERVKAKPKES